jgi:hypothetical protein
MASDEKDGLTPEEHIDRILEDTSHHIDALEEQIANIPKDEGPVPVLRPKWMGPSKSMTKQQENKQILRKEQQKYRDNVNIYMPELTKELSPKIQKRISAKLEAWNERGGFSREVYQKQLDELSRSQAVAKDLLFDNKWDSGSGGANNGSTKKDKEIDLDRD